jgi:single-strand DNA-binding protein
VKVRDWTTDERTGTSIEVEADSLGHDLLWGTSSYEKVANKGSSAHPEGEDDEVVL